MITINQIYSNVESHLNRLYRPLYVSSKLEPLPPEFPSVQITEINHFQIRSAIPLSFTQKNDLSIRRDIEAHVYSNLVNEALTEARDIMTEVEEIFREMGFIETYCGQTNNIDPSVVHLVGRFTRDFGDSDPLTSE